MKRFVFSFIVSALLAACVNIDPAGVLDGAAADDTKAVPASVGEGTLFPVAKPVQGTSVTEELLAAISAAAGDVPSLLVKHEGKVQKDAKGDDVLLINDQQMLSEKWPAIDFGQYSLVVGSYDCCDPSIYLASQWAGQRGSGKIALYLELKREEGFFIAHPETKFFAALYPKLPDAPVDIYRWDHYPNGLYDD